MSSSQEQKSPGGILSFLQVGVLEVVFIVLLVSVILLSLNYFNLVPLSQTFSFLSFLPQQGRPISTTKLTTAPSSKIKIPNIIYIITPDSQERATNSGLEPKFSPIKNSQTKVTGDLRIDVEIAIDGKSAREGSESSAFIFHNGLAGSKKDYRFLRLFYYPKDKNWGLQYQYNGKNQFSGALLFVPSGRIYGKFSLIISGKGRRVTIITPTGEQRTMQLADPLYSVTNQMSSMIQVAPNSEVTISSLSYQY